MKKKLGEILKALRDERGLTQLDVAKAVDVDQETVSRFEQLEESPKRGNTLRRMAEFYGLTVPEVQAMRIGKKVAAPVPTRFRIPIISPASAGRAREYDTSHVREYGVDLMNDDNVPGALYPYPAREPLAFRIDGDSMSFNGRESLEHGDIVIFCNEHEEQIPDRELVVARSRLDDSLWVKRVRYVDEDRLDLVSQNPKYDPIPMRREDVTLKRVKVIITNRYRGHIQG